MEVNDLEELKRLKEQMNSMKDQIKKYSYYNMDNIGDAIAIVMTAYEGIEYVSVRNYYTINEDYFYTYGNEEYYKKYYTSIHIIPKKMSSEEYGRYRITYDKKLNNRDICYLPPAYYTPHKKSYYIKDFLNYLYIKKVENNIINDKDFYIRIAQEFVENTKEEIEKRQHMIKLEYQKKLGPAPTKNELLRHGYWLDI